MKQILPIGIQSFKKLREGNYLYIDKTKNLYELITQGSKIFFLSRPRRFGKSLLLDTIRFLYKGEKELFTGLFAYDNWDFEKEKRPVIKISFGAGTIKSDGMDNTFQTVLDGVCIDNDIKISGIDEKDKFRKIIYELYKKNNKKVAILIDEYDKPILDNIVNIEEANKIREKLKNFYSVIKDNDEYIELVFITGVTKFSKVSLFSGLNNLDDLSLNPKVGTICGYTNQEITDNFGEYLDGVDREKMQKWYNGFNFLGVDKVYNPYDILLFLNTKKYSNHWFQTATPTFLTELLKQKAGFYHQPTLQNITVGEELIGSFDIEKIHIETLLYQTGYLTIKEQIETELGLEYKLQIPNHEIKQSLNKYIMYDYLEFQNQTTFISFGTKVLGVLKKGQIQNFIDLLNSLFAGIAYSSIQNICKYEGYYTSVIYVLLYSMGLDIIQEDITNEGRIDLTVFIGDYIYVLEFKVEKTGQKALTQIQEKRYSAKYKQENKKVIELGINFDINKKQIESFEYREFE